MVSLGWDPLFLWILGGYLHIQFLEPSWPPILITLVLNYGHWNRQDNMQLQCVARTSTGIEQTMGKCMWRKVSLCLVVSVMPFLVHGYEWWNSPAYPHSFPQCSGFKFPLKKKKILSTFPFTADRGASSSRETHFPKHFNPKCLHPRFPQFYLANAEDKTKGVGIFFSKRATFSPSQKIRDPEGRYIPIAGSL